MTKNEQIKKLFDENYQMLLSADITTPVEKNGICYDGIIDENVFENCSKKIIFLLKETNGNTENKNNDDTITIGLPKKLEDWDYRKWLQEQQAENILNSSKFYSSTFNKLCMWIDVFYNCISGKEISFEDYKANKYNETNFRKLLKKTGIINLKKTWGTSRTEWKNLYSYLHHEMNNAPIEVLKKEIDIIKPDVVICGSNQVFDFAQEIFNEGVLELELSNGDIFRYFKSQKTLFLDFYHPACMGSIEKYYNYAKLRFEAIRTLII